MNPSCSWISVTTFSLVGLLVVDSRAQTAPAPSPTSETVKLEAFTVTGSNIRRIDQESTLPVSVLDFDDLDVRAAPTA